MKYILFILFAVLISCNGKSDLGNAETVNQDEAIEDINPNGSSELALLMRKMVEEAEQMKKQVDAGETITTSLSYADILTATATEPEKVASVEYEAFAKSYLQTMGNLQAASNEEKVAHFDNMVDNCIACHKTLCPGPLTRIRKLKK